VLITPGFAGPPPHDTTAPLSHGDIIVQIDVSESLIVNAAVMLTGLETVPSLAADTINPPRARRELN
jgi:hypothetical protein